MCLRYTSPVFVILSTFRPFAHCSSINRNPWANHHGRLNLLHNELVVTSVNVCFKWVQLYVASKWLFFWLYMRLNDWWLPLPALQRVRSDLYLAKENILVSDRTLGLKYSSSCVLIDVHLPCNNGTIRSRQLSGASLYDWQQMIDRTDRQVELLSLNV